MSADEFWPSDGPRQLELRDELERLRRTWDPRNPGGLDDEEMRGLDAWLLRGELGHRDEFESW